MTALLLIAADALLALLLFAAGHDTAATVAALGGVFGLTLFAGAALVCHGVRTAIRGVRT